MAASSAIVATVAKLFCTRAFCASVTILNLTSPPNATFLRKWANVCRMRTALLLLATLFCHRPGAGTDGRGRLRRRWRRGRAEAGRDRGLQPGVAGLRALGRRHEHVGAARRVSVRLEEADGGLPAADACAVRGEGRRPASEGRA